MQVIAYSSVQNNLMGFMKKVNDDEAIIISTNRDDDNAVLVSQSEYENLLENAYILSSKANVDHINQSLQSLKDGQGKAREWE
ncbi:type II toxin-antitoxin system prevent-host-death family antitoxin [Fructobacillus sp. CRL 2054]|uniref:type II toxin-antitoxin system Phd/YefM family antitoxin n=1 Tax=Fructobacillus sp. CRL 2054 TaxID=2763007 RepID=UPI002378B435|nr:type II toxin-antitoxin system prevent-host-death family antitoxin [Fructobacillus sp. CRL 2054]MDD9138909.1 type II toxin-antitoxin system prevent-host-death family antitoxin [Fructobacillus sp. CRL 2054]